MDLMNTIMATVNVNRNDKTIQKGCKGSRSKSSNGSSSSESFVSTKYKIILIQMFLQIIIVFTLHLNS